MIGETDIKMSDKGFENIGRQFSGNDFDSTLGVQVGQRPTDGRVNLRKYEKHLSRTFSKGLGEASYLKKLIHD